MNELPRIENGEIKGDSLMVAEHFGKEHKHVMRDIKDEVDKLESQGVGAQSIFGLSSYTNSQNREMPCYLMNEEGLMQIAARYDAVARRKLILKIKELKERSQQDISKLSPELQMFKQIFDSVAESQLRQQQIEQRLVETKDEIQNMREVIQLDTTSWRSETQNMFVKIAQKHGGNQFIKDFRNEAYELLEARAGAKLSIRLTNKKRRMAEEGVAKSKRDKLNRLDIIADDKKLIEVYTAIVKEMAIRHGIA